MKLSQTEQDLIVILAYSTGGIVFSLEDAVLHRAAISRLKMVAQQILSGAYRDDSSPDPHSTASGHTSTLTGNNSSLLAIAQGINHLVREMQGSRDRLNELREIRELLRRNTTDIAEIKWTTDATYHNITNLLRKEHQQMLDLARLTTKVQENSDLTASLKLSEDGLVAIVESLRKQIEAAGSMGDQSAVNVLTSQLETTNATLAMIQAVATNTINPPAPVPADVPSTPATPADTVGDEAGTTLQPPEINPAPEVLASDSAGGEGKGPL